MINGVNRFVPDGMPAFVSSDAFKNKKRKLIAKKQKQSKTVFLNTIDSTFDLFDIHDGQCLSFHHHLRNGDEVIQKVCEVIANRNIKDLHFAPSSIFPSYTNMVDLIMNQNITRIHTNYLNGKVSKVISEGYLKNPLIMNTHGGRARSIESGELKIDVAFLACPVVDKNGNGTGSFGPTACGTLGYAISDLKYATKVVLVTDTIVDNLDEFQFDGAYVDAVVVVDSIGNSEGIVSGTTRLTRDPIGLKIAKDCANAINALGLIHEKFSMQTGAGKISLAVVKYIRDIMLETKITGDFGSGGITSSYVEMLNEGLFKELYDVQCFDLEAVKSYHDNLNHRAMSASEYGNPYENNPICDNLTFVILGATEVDLDFNVNVTTDSLGNIIGGSGGHADIAHGAEVTIIISPLFKSRIPIIKEKVTTVTTPGSDVDLLVTERGIAVNPNRIDLKERLKNSGLPIFEIRELYDIAHQITGVPRKIELSDEIIGYVEYRDGTIIDCLYKVKS
ncbi:MAG: citrate lyase subunit alpha [Bacilli bacterium]|nr:citrate lyase subunit alpha [Bacilli bacterium]MBN2876904.1 citrate lyase subunit alpha [Bacilli bacterium]